MRLRLCGFERRNLRLELAPGHAEQLHAGADLFAEGGGGFGARSRQALREPAIGFERFGLLPAQCGDVLLGGFQHVEFSAQRNAMRGQVADVDPVLACQLFSRSQAFLDG